MESSPREPALNAARLALLVLRASLSRDGAGLPDLYRVASTPGLLSRDEAARALAAVPKPAECRAVVEAGEIRVEVGPRVEDRWAAAHDQTPVRFAGRPGDRLAFLRKRYSEPLDELEVVCRGGGQYLRLTVAEMREWDRDYLLRVNHSCGLDFADSSYADLQRADREWLRGAAAFASFGPGGGIRVIKGPLADE